MGVTCNMISLDTIRKFVVNFLIYNREYDIDEAMDLFGDNKEHFIRVFDVLGDKFLTTIGEQINGKRNLGKDM